MHFHKLAVTVLAALFALALTAGADCGLIVEHLAGKAALEVATSGYEHLKSDHERKSRAGKPESRDHDAANSQVRRNDSKDRAPGDAGQTDSEDGESGG
jgi:hypothetical protein